MQLLARLTFIAATLALLTTSPISGREKSSQERKERPFIGSFDVSEKTRDVLLKRLKDKGFKGLERVYIPDGAGPNVLMYRGTKAEYDQALKIWWDLQAELESTDKGESTETKPATRSVPRRNDKTDEDAFSRLGLSDKQLKECQEHLKWRDEATKRFHENGGGQEAGMELNREWNGRLKKTMTADQYAKYCAYWETSAPKPRKTRPKTVPAQGKKTDEAIFAKLGLTDRQKTDLAKLQKEIDVLTDKMKEKPFGPEAQEEGIEINRKWRAGLERTLTKEQLQKYKEYWRDQDPPEGEDWTDDRAPTGKATELEGKWKVTTEILHGAELPADVAQTLKMTFTGDKLTWEGAIASNGTDYFAVESVSTCKITLGTEKNLKTIDINAAGGRMIKGIYKLENDKLTLCLGIPGAPRPTKFESTEEGKTSLSTLERGK